MGNILMDDNSRTRDVDTDSPSLSHATEEHVPLLEEKVLDEPSSDEGNEAVVKSRNEAAFASLLSAINGVNHEAHESNEVHHEDGQNEDSPKTLTRDLDSESEGESLEGKAPVEEVSQEALLTEKAEASQTEESHCGGAVLAESSKAAECLDSTSEGDASSNRVISSAEPSVISQAFSSLSDVRASRVSQSSSHSSHSSCSGALPRMSSLSNSRSHADVSDSGRSLALADGHVAQRAEESVSGIHLPSVGAKNGDSGDSEEEKGVGAQTASPRDEHSERENREDVGQGISNTPSHGAEANSQSGSPKKAETPLIQSDSSFAEDDISTQTFPVLSLDDVEEHVEKQGDGEEGEFLSDFDDVDAPDLSSTPVLPKSEFERTLIFERNENRWDDAEEYVLPEPGDVVGNYRVLSMLGKGGFGAVYCAKNLTLGREEALKLILPSAKSECSDIDRRFEREVDIVSRLEHPNIVRLYSSGKLEHNVLWMTMELIRGTRLDKRMEDGPMPFARAKTIMLQILSGLMEAHRRQIVHRDLKPANIMLARKEGYDEQVIILDFGLSKAIGASEDTSVQELTLVDSRRIYGTPQYMAPEQLNMGILGPWTDVYAAGLIFFELITGRPAVTGDSLFEVAYKQSYESIIYPELLRDTVIETILNRACAKNPAERYKNAGEFFNALQHVQDPSDPPSVLREDFRSSGALGANLMRNQMGDGEEGEKTRVSMPAIEPPPPVVIHAERTGGGKNAYGLSFFFKVATSFLSLLFVVMMVLVALGIVQIKF